MQTPLRRRRRRAAQRTAAAVVLAAAVVAAVSICAVVVVVVDAAPVHNFVQTHAELWERAREMHAEASCPWSRRDVSRDGGEGGADGQHGLPFALERKLAKFDVCGETVYIQTVANDPGIVAPAAAGNALPRACRAPLAIVETLFRGNYSTARFDEIVGAVKQNLRQNDVLELHVFAETGLDPHTLFRDEIVRRGVRVVNVQFVSAGAPVQPTYAHLFGYANSMLPRRTVVVTNSDIYFDHTLTQAHALLGDPYPGYGGGGCPASQPEHRQQQQEQQQQPWATPPSKPVALALTRYPTPECPLASGNSGFNDKMRFRNNTICSHAEIIHSYDAFVFRPPVPNKALCYVKTPQNRLGAENVVAGMFDASGFHVINACRRIYSYHKHCTQERGYVRKVSLRIDGRFHGRAGMLLGNGSIFYGGKITIPPKIRHSLENTAADPCARYMATAPPGIHRVRQLLRTHEQR